MHRGWRAIRRRTGCAGVPTLLGSSGGNNNDFDENGNTIVDCCGGTLGSLVKDDGGREYLLSNNHVLARSDHAAVGDTIVQPGLIDNNCTPNGDGPGTVPVAALTTWLPLRSPQTNADAAIAQVASHTVDTTGSILELGSDSRMARWPLRRRESPRQAARVKMQPCSCALPRAAVRQG